MIHFGELMSLVRREAERTARKFHKTDRVGFISSYDPKEHKAKVTFQPTGAESGWIPMSAMAVGNKFGEHHAPNIGDQVRVEYQEGEHDVGRVTTRLYNKQNPPHQLQPGEYAKIHQNGAGHKHFQDGTVKYAGPQFFQVGQQQPGQSGQTQTGSNNGTQQNQQQQQQQQNQQAGKQNFQYNPDGSTVFNVPDPQAQGQGQPQKPQYTATVQKDINHTSTKGNWNRAASSGTISDTAQASINRSAQQNISDTAQTIKHNGDVDVAGDMEVSSFVDASAFGTTSDRRIKSNIDDLTDVLRRVMALPLRTFTIHPSKMKDGKIERHPTSHPVTHRIVTHNGIEEQTDEYSFEIPLRRSGKSRNTFGAVAQEVRELFPEIVHGDEKTGILTLEEAKIGILALAALQEYVAKTESEISQLKARISELEK